MRYLRFVIAFLMVSFAGYSEIIIAGSKLSGCTIGVAASGGGGGGGCVSAYRTNDTFFGGSQTGIGTGDRTEPSNLYITAKFNGVAKPQICDNNFNTGQFFFSVTAAAGQTIQVQFNSAVVVTGFTWFQQNSDTHGTWQVEGSNDGSTWTAIGGTFTLGGGTSTALGFADVITTPSANTTSYTYYHLIGVSGNTSGNPWLFELWIQDCQ